MQTIPEISTDRQAYRAAVAAIASRAHEKLPTLNGHIDAAVKLVLCGDVMLLPDGTAAVASQSEPSKTYHVNGVCECPDYERAPEHLCKHRLGAAIARRAQTMMQTPSATSQPAPLPEAPVSITLKATLHGQEVLVTLRGTDFASVRAQVEEASAWLQAQRGPVSDDTHTCPTHGVQMKLNHGKNGSSWWSHRTAEGWCKGHSNN